MLPELKSNLIGLDSGTKKEALMEKTVKFE